MKLKFDVAGKHQPDPFIFEDGGRLYLYVTNPHGVEAYSADDLFGIWHYEGVVASIAGRRDYWAPSVMKYGDRYYLYVSSSTDEEFQYMHASVSDSPLGPFENPKCFYKRFSIDSHVVQTEDGLFLWYAEDNTDCDRIGTRIYVDRLLDPMTPANMPKEVIVPQWMRRSSSATASVTAETGTRSRVHSGSVREIGSMSCTAADAMTMIPITSAMPLLARMKKI